MKDKILAHLIGMVLAIGLVLGFVVLPIVVFTDVADAGESKHSYPGTPTVRAVTFDKRYGGDVHIVAKCDGGGNLIYYMWEKHGYGGGPALAVSPNDKACARKPR